MVIVDRYIFKSFITIFTFCIFFLWMLYIIGDIFGFLDEILKERIPVSSLAAFYWYMTPFILTQIIPVSTLIACVFLLGNLNRSNEITAFRASGISIWRILKPMLIGAFIISLFTFVLNDRLLPPACYVCEKNCSSKYGLCDECLSEIRHIPPPYCPKCGIHLNNNDPLCKECATKKSPLERSWSSAYYKDSLKKCIHLFKYKGLSGLTGVLSDTMVDFARKNRIHDKVDLIVPVPLSPAKKRERTYNHAEVLAHSLSKNLSLPLDAGSLKKVRWTKSQSALDKEARSKNVRDSFRAVKNDSFRGKNVLLIDDVYTTGSTINECARVLIEAGAGSVFSLTLARS
ncbi:LptF/LptG family permease [Candidatus Omnitrophota bacterium]